MAEMCLTFGAEHFGAFHAKGRIDALPYILFAMGCQKLGHPVPDSNLVSEENSAFSQQTQR